MGHRLTPIDKFFIDHHREMGAEALSKQIGCTVRTVYNYINTNPGRVNTKQEGEGVPPPAAQAELPSKFDPPKPPPVSMNLVGRRKHGNSAAVVMTEAMSEAGDELYKRLSKTKEQDYIHIINPDKDD